MTWFGLCAAALTLGGTLILTSAETQDDEVPTWTHHELPDLAKKCAESGGPWLPFLDRDTLSCGIYRLEAGATDGQGPHERDEVYYIVEGESGFTVGEDRCEVRPGTILFVQAGETHRFVDIQKDLTILVFFSKAKAQD